MTIESLISPPPWQAGTARRPYNARKNFKNAAPARPPRRRFCRPAAAGSELLSRFRRAAAAAAASPRSNPRLRRASRGSSRRTAAARHPSTARHRIVVHSAIIEFFQPSTQTTGNAPLRINPFTAEHGCRVGGVAQFTDRGSRASISSVVGHMKLRRRRSLPDFGTTNRRLKRPQHGRSPRIHQPSAPSARQMHRTVRRGHRR